MLRKDILMHRLPKPSSHSRRRSILTGFAIVALAATALAVAMTALFGTPQGAPATAIPSPVPHFVDVGKDRTARIGTMRTLVIGGPNETLPGLSGTNGVLLANLVEGQLPANATQATVRTDSNCAPDQNGISHCLNKLDFGTMSVMVQHHHVMKTTPCLTPGEQVQVMTLAQYQKTLE